MGSQEVVARQQVQHLLELSFKSDTNTPKENRRKPVTCTVGVGLGVGVGWFKGGRGVILG